MAIKIPEKLAKFLPKNIKRRNDIGLFSVFAILAFTSITVYYYTSLGDEDFDIRNMAAYFLRDMGVDPLYLPDVPSDTSPIVQKVLVLIYDTHTLPGFGDPFYTDPNLLSRKVESSMENASKFRGYSNSDATPEIDFSIVNTITHNKPCLFLEYL